MNTVEVQPGSQFEPPPRWRRVLRYAFIAFITIFGFVVVLLLVIPVLVTGFLGTEGTDPGTSDTASTWIDTGALDTGMTVTDTMSTDTSATSWTDTSATGTTGTSTTDPLGNVDERLRLNGWIEHRSMPEPDPLPRGEVGKAYNFTADLGYWRADAFAGASSLLAGADLARVIRAAPPQQTVLAAYARPVVLGRGLELLGGQLDVEVWRGGVWQRVGPSDGMVPFDIDLVRMRRARMRTPASSTELRFAGLRFGIRATRHGCAAVGLSIWNEDKTLPLDNVIFPITIGDADCASRRAVPDSDRDVAGLTRLLSERPDATFDAALHIFEYDLPGGTPGAVAIYVPARAGSGCGHYAWQTTRAISSVVSTKAFTAQLEDARKNDHYARLARTLKDHLFPARDDAKCGDGGALAHLSALAASAPPKLFVRLISSSNETLFMPIGIVFLAKDEGGKRLFANMPIVSQSLPRETYRIEGCLSELAFAIPPKLDRVDDTIELDQSPLFKPIQAISDVDTFMRQSDAKPVTLVLLAHHGEGIIHFDDPAVQWDVSFMRRSFAPGSVAVLSTCNAGSVQPSQMRLARDLNEAGVDAMLLSTFDVKPSAGIALAKNVAATLLAARDRQQAATLLEIYAEAREQTIRDLAKVVAEGTAEGLMSEFTLAGNGGIRICGKGD